MSIKNPITQTIIGVRIQIHTIQYDVMRSGTNVLIFNHISIRF
jgi:hypothetical protein